MMIFLGLGALSLYLGEKKDQIKVVNIPDKLDPKPAQLISPPPLIIAPVASAPPGKFHTQQVPDHVLGSGSYGLM